MLQKSSGSDCCVQYVARYEESVTPGLIASVPSQGNQQMAAGILQVSSSQLESILGESELYAEAGAGPPSIMMEGENYRVATVTRGLNTTLLLQEMICWSVS